MSRLSAQSVDASCRLVCVRLSVSLLRSRTRLAADCECSYHVGDHGGLRLVMSDTPFMIYHLSDIYQDILQDPSGNG